MFLEQSYGTRMMREELGRSRRVALSPDQPEPLRRGFSMASQEAIYALNYHKAAYVLHMLRGVMGLSTFTRLLREISVEARGSMLTTELFIAKAEALHGEDLSWFFGPWLDSAGIPSFEVIYSVERLEGRTAPTYRLRGTIEQRDAAIRHPILVRVNLEGAPPFEDIVWVHPGTTPIEMTLPTPPVSFEFDPNGEVLHSGATIELIQQQDRRPSDPHGGSRRQGRVNR